MSQSFPVDILITNFNPENARVYVKTDPLEFYLVENFEPRVGVEIRIVSRFLEIENREPFIIEGILEQYEDKRSFLGEKVCISGSIDRKVEKGKTFLTSIGHLCCF